MERSFEEKKILKRFNVLAVIVIIIGLFAILYPIFITLKRMSAEDDAERIVKTVSAAAIKYAEDNSIEDPTLITVNKLIVDGYVKADNSDGELFNPQYDQRVFNCNTIYITKENNEYKAVYNKEEDCSLMESEKLNINLVAKNAEGKILKSGEVSVDDLYLTIEGAISLTSITWYVDGNEIDSANNTLKYFVSSLGDIDSNYSVNVVTSSGTVDLTFRVIINKPESIGE